MSANTQNSTENTVRQWDNGDETELNIVLKSYIKSEASSPETEAEEL